MTVADRKPYTTQLQAGLGLVNETKTLLDLWSPGMLANQLHQVALESGRFPTVTARRLRNIIVECFAPRYLVAGGAPAAHLKRLSATVPTADLTQLMLVFTSRANPILGDFVRHVYWPRYAGGYTHITNDDARTFVERGIGDVLIAWENEAYLALKELGPDKFDLITPSISILAEPPVSIVDKVVDKRGTRKLATAYLEYLYSPEGQTLAAENHYRPRDAKIAAKYAKQFAPVKLFTIDDAFGGWTAGEKTHFADGGVFAKISGR